MTGSSSHASYNGNQETGKYTRAYKDWMEKHDNNKMYVHLKEFWRLEHQKMKCTNPTEKQYENGMNAAEMKQDSAQTDMASRLEQCANAMIEGQRKQQELQQQFENAMTTNLAALTLQCNNNKL